MNPIEQIRGLIEEHEADAALITFLPDIRWACGFTGSNGLLLVGRERSHFLTDGRYIEQSAREIANAGADTEVQIAAGNLFEHAVGHGLLADIQRAIVQSDHLTIDAFARMKEQAPAVNWMPVASLLERLVALKTIDEIERIRRAQAITDAVFAHLLEFIKPGMTEQDVAAEIVYQHLKRGASAMSFDPIVAGGPNSALPHARPTSRPLQPGDLVVIDMGCFRDGYASDMTRTVAIGQPDAEAAQVYETVLDAQRAALDAAAAGISSKALDAVARNVISKADYGDYFTHSLGHGVGLQIHEWPSVSWRTDVQLEAGMAITIEPGIYLPGRFGVRIENLIVLNPGGHEDLTESPLELIVL